MYVQTVLEAIRCEARKQKKLEQLLEEQYPKISSTFPTEKTPMPCTSHSVGSSKGSTSPPDGSYVLTRSGSKLLLANPNQDQINLNDIALSLANLCRFTGHCSEFYSVAQHSVLCAGLAEDSGCSDEQVRQCLMHDASEAYVNDLNSPVKQFIDTSYRDFEDTLQNIIFDKYGVERPLPPAVKLFDKAAYHIESIHLMPGSRSDHTSALSKLGVGGVCRPYVEGRLFAPHHEAADIFLEYCSSYGLSDF